MASAGGQVQKFDERFFLQSEDDLPFEEELLRNTYSVRHWLRYIDHKKSTASPETRNDAVNMLFERSLKELPGSYKLWIRYLRWRVDQTNEKEINDPIFNECNNCFERSLVFMHKMPRVWIEYLQLLIHQCFITRTRRTFDRALQSLPTSQHLRIWPMYLEFVKSYNIPETAVRVYERYLKLCPDDAESYISFLLSIDRLDEAAVKLADIVNDDRFISKEGKSKFVLWSELCDLISQHPDEMKTLNVEAIIREGIRRFTDLQGKLWNSLAEYFTRAGLFERARDVYEEAILQVTTIRDFSQVFDAYTQSEERIINILMAQEEGLDEDQETELELRMTRLEDLIERRPLLLNAVSLRQNPHNVSEWLKRVALLENKPIEIINTFMSAVNTIDPKQAVGRVASVWIEFAKFYEVNGQVEDARLVFEKATTTNFVKVDDLADVWCEFAEMEIRHSNPKAALRLMERATAAPGKKVNFFDQNEPAQNRVFKSLKIWSLYADLEESFGTFKSTKSVYDRIIDLKIATPQIIINFGMYLEENNYFEEAFRAYEKGVDLFKFPLVFDIWNVYLRKFMQRYGGSKLERTRDLFEQCLSSCPKKFAKGFYLMYAQLEEQYGLAKHSMAIYDRAVTHVDQKSQLEVFNIYIKKATELFGLTHTRGIYEKAIEILPDDQARDMCLRFAELERKLGEIDRARAVYAHASQMSDPRTCASFWNEWREFEIKHGNEDTIREMLRIKRSVQATFNTQVNFMASHFIKSSAGDDMKALEAEASKAVDEETQEALKEVSGASVKTGKKDIMFVKSTTIQEVLPEDVKPSNPDEIHLDEDEEEEEEKQERPSKDIRVEQKEVPKEVFGGLLPTSL